MREATTMVDPKAIFKNAPVFASFAVKDLDPAREFYGRKLGLDVRDDKEMGIFEIHGPDNVARHGVSEAGPPARGLHGPESAGS